MASNNVDASAASKQSSTSPPPWINRAEMKQPQVRTAFVGQTLPIAVLRANVESRQRRKSGRRDARHRASQWDQTKQAGRPARQESHSCGVLEGDRRCRSSSWPTSVRRVAAKTNRESPLSVWRSMSRLKTPRPFKKSTPLPLPAGAVARRLPWSAWSITRTYVTDSTTNCLVRW